MIGIHVSNSSVSFKRKRCIKINILIEHNAIILTSTKSQHIKLSMNIYTCMMLINFYYFIQETENQSKHKHPKGRNSTLKTLQSWYRVYIEVGARLISKTALKLHNQHHRQSMIRRQWNIWRRKQDAIDEIFVRLLDGIKSCLTDTLYRIKIKNLILKKHTTTPIPHPPPSKFSWSSISHNILDTPVKHQHLIENVVLTMLMLRVKPVI